MQATGGAEAVVFDVGGGGAVVVVPGDGGAVPWASAIDAMIAAMIIAVIKSRLRSVKAIVVMAILRL